MSAETASAELSTRPRPTVGVQAAVFDDSKVLLQRRANVFGDGTWGLPGGHLEFGESFEEAARRELAEECGLRAIELRTVLPHNTAYERTHYVQIAVEVLDWDGDVENREPDRCSDLRFFDLGELPGPLFDPSVHILDYLRARSHTDAVEQRLSLTLALGSDDGSALGTVTVLLLLGSSALGLLRKFTPGQRDPRKSVVSRFATTGEAWHWIRVRLAGLLDEGYVMQDCHGDAPLDRILELFPSAHPVALRSLEAPGAPMVHPNQQLLLLPEHCGW